MICRLNSLRGVSERRKSSRSWMVKSAIQFHIETFGAEAIDTIEMEEIMETFVAEVAV